MSKEFQQQNGIKKYIYINNTQRNHGLDNQGKAGFSLGVTEATVWPVDKSLDSSLLTKNESQG
jgi:hypothetical protein